MSYDGCRVVTRSVDERGVPPMLESLADDVHAWCGGDAAVLPDVAVRTADR
jgi:hypothetical protein